MYMHQGGDQFIIQQKNSLKVHTLLVPSSKSLCKPFLWMLLATLPQQMQLDMPNHMGQYPQPAIPVNSFEHPLW